MSGLGKGIVSASIGKLLNPLKVVPVKCDGYLNVDPGTMNPVEHGEVFVLDDGGEVDMDFGHYERFMNVDCKFEWNLTSGKIFLGLIEQERKGEFLGKTIQVIPHVTGDIRRRWQEIGRKEDADVLLIEIGGTVGDVENLWYLEAVRELEREKGHDHVCVVHLAYVPSIDENGQQKTKPTQQSVVFLRERGLMPDIIIGRSEKLLEEWTKKKIAWLCNVETPNVISDPNTSNVYELPLIFEREGLREQICERLQLRAEGNLNEWSRRVERLQKAHAQTTIAICGKYTELADSYASVREALKHASAELGILSTIKWVETTEIENGLQTVEEALSGVAGVIVPGGFGSRGTEGKIQIIQHCREHDIPFLGLCLGLQLAVIEFARNKCKLEKANSTEMDELTPYPVIDILPDQRKVNRKGATMRLGAYTAKIEKGSKVEELYNATEVLERHRHRFEVNPTFHEILEQHGMKFSGKSPDGTLVEFVELPSHPFFIATQSHPELKSRLEKPAPLFVGFLKACEKPILAVEPLPKAE